MPATKVENSNELLPGAASRNKSMEFELCLQSANFLLGRTRYRPKIGIICGTGLAGLGDLLESADCTDYSEIPNFPVSTVPQHRSRCLFGLLQGVQVFLMQGRFHLYEGYEIGQCAMPIRVMKLLGIERLILSNAAGGLNPNLKIGDVMLLKDHVNLMGFIGVNPLAGPEDPRFGPRFFAMNNAYAPRWRQHCLKIAGDVGLSNSIHEGVYTMVGGPNFETPAELRMLKHCGVDAVGMSTVHEALTAHHCGISVFAFSLITNICVLSDDSVEQANVAEVLETAEAREKDLKLMVSRMVKEMDNV